jgi:hypothetical protein
VLHGTRERFGGSVRDTRCLLLPLAFTYPCPGVRTRAWAFSSHGACSDQASDTSVATPSYVALVGPSLYLPALVSSSVTELSRSRLCPREEAAKVAVTTCS